MRIYLAGYEENHVKHWLSDERKKQVRILLSYFYANKSALKKLSTDLYSGEVFCDSGAFSAYTKNVDIDIDNYCTFLLDNIELFDTIAGLDVIGDAEASLANQNYMENEYGIEPLVTFHYGESFDYLKHYVEKYDYIAIGGLIAAGNKNIKPFLDKVFSEYICDKNGNAKIKVHGFAMTSPVLMARYPWHSVDSSSWSYGARNCFIYMPKMVKGEWDYTKKPHPYVLSTSRTEEIRAKRPAEWRHMLEYFKYVDMPLGTSHFKNVNDPESYKLEANEQWAIRKYSGRVEVIDEPGVLTSSHARNVLNIIFFQEMEKYLKEHPPQFVIDKKTTSFGL